MRPARDVAARLRGRPGSSPGRLPVLVCALVILGALAGLAGCMEDPTAAEPECGQAPLLQPGTTQSGSLDDDDPRFEDARIDYYSVILEDSTLIFLQLSSSEFDPFLYLFGTGNAVAAQSYDPHGQPSGEPESAMLARDLAPGCHLVGATAWNPEGTGGYTLRLNIAEPLVHGAAPNSER